MTTLDYAALIASFPTNSSGQITALNMRNFVDSVELKYDNWNIVKAGQPEGAKFPDPVAGVIDLPEDSIWVINGAVTVLGTLNCLGNNQIISLSGSFSINVIVLDNSMGATTLITVGSGISATFKGVLLYLANDSQTLISATDAALVNFDACGFVINNAAWGSIDNTLKFVMLNCFSSSLSGSSPMTFLGTCTSVVIEGYLTTTGFLGTQAQIFDFTTATAIESLRVEACTVDLTVATSFIAATDATVEAGIFVNNTVLGTPIGPFIVGINNFSINSTFSGNTGIPNTKIVGGIVMSRNASVTTSPAANAYTQIIGNTQDVITLGTCRFQRSSALTLQYIGKEQFVGVAVLSLSYRRATLNAAQAFTATLFKNNVAVSQPFTMTLASIVRTSAILATATLSVPFSLVNGMTVVISGAAQSPYNGSFIIGGVAGLVFTYPLASDPIVNATGTLVAQLPVEISAPQQATDSLFNSSINIPIVLNTNDTLQPFIKSDGASINSVVDTILLTVS